MSGSARMAVLTVLLAPPIAGAVTVDDLPDSGVYRVSAIRVEGAKDVSKSAIRKAMQTQLPPWYMPWKRWYTDLSFNPDVFRVDLERVRGLLRESGYYEATVSHELNVKDDRVEIILNIEEGPAVKVTDITLVAIDFSLPASDEATLRASMPLAPGDTLTQKEYDESRARLERFYLEGGFAYVEVKKAAVVDTAADQAQVTYTITRGRPAVFGETTIEGLEVVDEKLVRREIAYEPGAPYDPKQIEKTQANVFGLELFRSVTVEPANLDERSGIVRMAIKATEGPPRSIKVGIGYGLEDQVRAQLQWRHNNFLGGGRRLGVRLKGSFIEQAVEGEFRQPYFLHPKQTFVLPLTQTRQDEPGFTVLQSRLAPRVERKLPADVTASVGYNIEYDELTDVPGETKERLDDFTARGFVSSFTAVVERNTTTDLLDPHRGSVLTLTLEQAGGPWQGDFTFYRATFEARKYLPVFGERVLAGRFRIGVGDGFGQSDDLPMFRRFFAGGINSTRGYGRHELGPLTSDEDPIGGRSLMEGNIEFRTPVYKGVGAVVFCDAGLVKEKAFRYDPGDLQYAVGPGIRYNTPVGPLRLDVGFPLNAPSGLPSWQIHFSIGQAF